MNEKVEKVFEAWLKLTEDEKRDFIKELFHFNNLEESQKKVIVKKYLKG